MRQQIVRVGLAIGFALLSFQNCTVSKPVLFSESSDSKSAPTEGHGHGYDGKIYLVLGPVCPDSSNIQSRIVMKSEFVAELTRDRCQDISPVALTSDEFQLNPNNPDELIYQGQPFNAQIPFGSTVVDLSTVQPSIYAGFSYIWVHEFGSVADTMTSMTQSKLHLYEDGVEIGPAHSYHADIGSLGLGRFSHWDNGSLQSLYFSASDNSNPQSNGKVYSFKIQ